jgi:hypothetical protein
MSGISDSEQNTRINEIDQPPHLNIEGYKAIAEELRAYRGSRPFPRGSFSRRYLPPR